MAFERIAIQIDALLPAFNLEAESSRVRAIYAVLCRRSLNFPVGARPATPSRLNANGMPVQFATVVGAPRMNLRLIVDPGPLDTEPTARVANGYRAMRDVAELIGAEDELERAAPILTELAPVGSPTLRRDPAGAFWIGAAFTPGEAVRLRIYVNGTWGTAAEQRDRVRRFAGHFGRTLEWDGLADRLPSALAPLGLAVTLTPGGQTRGAIYLRAFGLRISDYACLASAASGRADADRIRAFGAAVLGDAIAHPTPSAALSFNLGSEPGFPTELEFCAHCLFRNDNAAQRNLERVFALNRLDPTPYRSLVDILLPSAAKAGPALQHAFLGSHAKSGVTAYTVYIAPNLSLPGGAS